MIYTNESFAAKRRKWLIKLDQTFKRIILNKGQSLYSVDRLGFLIVYKQNKECVMLNTSSWVQGQEIKKFRCSSYNRKTKQFISVANVFPIRSYHISPFLPSTGITIPLTVLYIQNNYESRCIIQSTICGDAVFIQRGLD